MKKFNCVLVDDEPVARRILRKYLADLPGFCVVGSCSNALKARSVLEKKSVDLLFLDLEMPILKGFPFLRTLLHPPAVIITTAHRKYALEGYELEVLDYLLKPISLPRFLKAINRFTNLHRDTKTTRNAHRFTDHIYVTCKRKAIRLEKSDIKYIQGMNNYIRIFYRHQEFVIYSSLTNILKKLGADFIRIHKSHIINRNQITAVNRSMVEIDGVQLAVGNMYQDIAESIIKTNSL